MKLNTADNNSSEESKRAISRLCFDCGVATRMEYGTDGSGAWPQYIAEGIYKYFGYKASTLRILYRSCFATQEEWNDIVKKELDAGRPIIYSGYSETGGHCFVFDGYDSNDFVHVNWGWQGQCDGYFAIDVLNAQYNDVYKDGHDMIVGLEPDYLGSDTKPQPWYPYVMGGINCNGTSKGYKLGSQIFCDVPKIYNKAPFVMTWTVGIGLFDNVGNLVCNVKKQNFNEESDELVFGGFYGKNSFTTVVSIPSTCPDGEYTLKLMFKQDGYDEWFLPDVEGGSQLNCVSVSVSDGRAYINKIPVSITTNEVEDCQVVDYYSFDGLKQKDVTAHGLHIEKVKNIDGSITYRKVFTK